MREKFGELNCPKLNFVIVTKRISDKFFVKDMRTGELSNPNGGLIVDQKIVQESGWEFLMVA